MFVVPRKLVDVISVMPAIRPNWRSRGAATDVAMVSGSAPGSPADTCMVGKSTLGKGATGSSWKATIPESNIPRVMRVVATGLWIKIAEKFI
jgi:hypothetical protein